MQKCLRTRPRTKKLDTKPLLKTGMFNRNYRVSDCQQNIPNFYHIKHNLGISISQNVTAVPITWILRNMIFPKSQNAHNIGTLCTISEHNYLFLNSVYSRTINGSRNKIQGPWLIHFPFWRVRNYFSCVVVILRKKIRAKANFTRVTPLRAYVANWLMVKSFLKKSMLFF